MEDLIRGMICSAGGKRRGNDGLRVTVTHACHCSLAIPPWICSACLPLFVPRECRMFGEPMMRAVDAAEVERRVSLAPNSSPTKYQASSSQCVVT